MTPLDTFVTEHFDSLVRAYASASCFRTEPSTALFPPNPWRRPLDRERLRGEPFAPLTAAETCSARGLDVHRLLLNVYEQDLTFLNEAYTRDADRKDFEAFYDPSLVTLGKALRSRLETAAYGFLDEAVDLRGDWTAAKLVDYVTSVIARGEAEESGVVRGLLAARDPKTAAAMLLIQIAPDALSEASAMGRTLLGVFGHEQSTLMRVFMDEYGLGVHPQKHGTLYEYALQSLGLSAETHHYYNFYLPSSLLMTNFFHFLCIHKKNWFRYLGSLYYLEAAMPHFVRQLSDALKKIFGDGVHTGYFDEHAHIDPYHRKMVLDDLIVSSIARYGEGIIPDILYGFEAIRVVQNLVDDDFERQARFALDLEPLPEQALAALTPRPRPRADGDRWSSQVDRVAHVAADDTVVTVHEGAVRASASGIAWLTVRAGERIFVPKGRMVTLIGEPGPFRFEGVGVVPRA